MASIILDGIAFLAQTLSLTGLAYGGLLCLNADSMFQVARNARASARKRATTASVYVIAAHS
jgi:hypothetical protein